MRRDLVGAGLVGMVVLAALPAYTAVFTAPTWRASTIVAALTALLAAVAVRRARGGILVGALISAGGLLVTLPWLLGLTGGPVLPSFEILRELRALVAASLVELEMTPAPAIPTAALALPVVAGFWAITHVAHELLVRAHRSGFALVALAVLWASPLVVPMPRSDVWPQAVPFLVAAAVLLWVTGRWDAQSAEHDRLSVGGITVAAFAIIGALIAPGLLPGYQATPWVEIGADTQPHGYQPIVDVGDRLQLPEERELLRVRSSQPTYLRLAGLDSFDGFTWRLGPPDVGIYQPDPASLYTATGPLPPEEPAASTEPVYAEIEVLDLENIYVPVPYQPVEVLGPRRDEMVWSTEGGFLATWDTAEGGLETGVREGLTYRVRAARPDPTFEELAAIEVDEATRARWTQLPGPYDGLREQAEEVYDAAEATTNVGRALALQEWFADPEGDFTYDLDVPALRGDEALERFVLEDKVGYCEYFATAMAVMLRATGVPARVAVGFLPGEETLAADVDAGRELTEYTVSTSDAHAWVEVLFPGAGWITFEPTPRADDAQIAPTSNDLAPVESVGERRERELLEQEQDPAAADDPTDPDTPEDSTPDAADTPRDATDPADAEGEDSGLSTATMAWIGGIALSGLAVAFGVSGRRRSQHVVVSSPPSERIVRAQRHLLAAGARYGVGRRPDETTRELLRRWRSEGRVDHRGEAFATIAQAGAFGGRVDRGTAEQAERLATELEEMLRSSVDRRQLIISPVRVPVTTLGQRARRVGRTVRDRSEQFRTPSGDRS